MSKFAADAGSKVGLEIWRIEKLDPVPWPKEKHGVFMSGDCFIVLSTRENKHGTLEQDLHFWLGRDSSQDEQGAVAYQTVTLDDQCGGRPVQHREVQGHESAAFLSLFDSVQYLDGGVDSAFNKVDRDAYETRLFQIKGRRHARVAQVELSASSLNSGDVFVLDGGLILTQWNGASANKYEKFKALEFVTKLNDHERGARAQIVVLEEGKDDDDEAFWAALGGSRADVKSAEEGGSDDVKPTPAKIFGLDGSLVAEGKLHKETLATDGIFIVDSGSAVAVWVGRGADAAARKEAMTRGTEYLASSGKPAWTPLTRVVEGAETPIFKGLFVQWDPPRTVDVSTPAAKKEKTVANTSEMHQRRQQAEEKMADDGSGSIKVWRIEDFAKVPLPESQYGEFFAGDAYIVLYTYLKNNREHYIIYFWIGKDSTSDEKGSAALLAVDMDDQLSGAATQVRVAQGKEPNHFLTLFKGNMVVHSGGRASGFKNRDDADSYDVDGVSLYHVRGTNSVNTRAVAVAEQASSLNSGDVFVLLTPGTLYKWAGAGANDDERAVGDNVAQRLRGDRDVVEVAEGEEPDAFWDAIGGKGEYPSTQAMVDDNFEPRLFQCSDVTGSFEFEEIFNFSQDDLIQEDVMILDQGVDGVFVWIGNGSTADERKLALKTALDYVANAPDGRDPDTPVFKVNAGEEPPSFTSAFLGWDDVKASDFSDPYAAKLAASGAAQGGAAAPAPLKKQASATRVTADDEDISGPSYSKKFSLQELQERTATGVDPKNLHRHLSDEDFEATFGMPLQEFEKLAAWKQAAAKKKHKLF